YLLEPLVGGVERVVPKGAHARAISIALVYLIGIAAFVTAARSVAPAAVDDFRRMQTSLPHVSSRFDAMAPDRVSRTLVTEDKQAAWLLLAPVVAAFFLDPRASLAA